MHKPKPISEWHEDFGPVLWWKFPITEPPYVGTPLDTPQRHIVALDGEVVSEIHLGGWPGYHTHWTVIPSVEQPQA